MTLLTHHLLTSNALWSPPHKQLDLQSTLRFISIFRSAAVRRFQSEDQQNERKEGHRKSQTLSLALSSTKSRRFYEQWVQSVVQGADDRSPALRHVLVYCGLLAGVTAHDQVRYSGQQLRASLGAALVRTVNLALECVKDESEHAAGSITLALSYSFELLSDPERSRFNYDRLLPILIGSAFLSDAGYCSADYLQSIDADLVFLKLGDQPKLSWPEPSPSFSWIRHISQQPLLTIIGPLARVVAHTVLNVHQPGLVQSTLDELATFSRTFEDRWRDCRLSQIDVVRENMLLDAQTVSKTLPVLRHVFRSTLFAIIAILRSIMERLLNDGALARDDIAPTIATRTLRILYHINFIFTHSTAPLSFSQYTSVNLVAIDVLSAYPTSAHSFLTSIQPPEAISAYPPDIARLVFFLNVSEHLTLTLTLEQDVSLFLSVARPFLAPTSELALHHLAVPIFEAAHSLYLSVLSAPHNAQIAERHLLLYADQVLRLFPASISPRQFRLALKSLVRLASPPSILAVTQPGTDTTLLELLRHRCLTARSLEGRCSAVQATPYRQEEVVSDVVIQRESPAATLVLTLIDCLPVLSTATLLQWLPLIAELINHGGVAYETAERDRCRRCFWECISGSEMDVERAGLSATWWGTKGGKNMVLDNHIPETDGLMMSGALALSPRGKL